MRSSLDVQEPDASDNFHRSTIRFEQDVTSAVYLEAHDDLICFVYALSEVVPLSPYSRVVCLPPVGIFIITADEANHIGVLHKPSDAVCPAALV